MEGIDRLHQIAEDVGRTVWLRDLGAALSDTADAIEGGMRDLSGYESDVLAWVEKNGGLDAVRERLIPEDMSWPRYAGGSPVEIGDEVVGPDYGEQFKVSSVEFHANGFTLHDKNGFSKWYESDDRFKRPPVFAADGKPLEVGQTVWHTKTGAEYRVLSLPDGEKGAWLKNSGGKYFLDYAVLTHQRPVLAADGLPIKAGDTVYLLPGEWCGEYPLYYYNAGDEMVVKELCSDHQHEGVLRCVGDGKCNCFPLPYQLTHTKPEPTDSLERIADEIDRLREDVAQHLGDYLYDEYGNDSIQFSMELVAKRCRALAERERGE